ncbi:MAG: type IV-A pilus assembly ATPase PilB [Gammaproteobacteria bacterium]|jgi:type IV pilus assembly protein PilB|nr:type IV-A pilus assembly ATPase PilB [Gammaproteobacteria bacterium]MBT3870664.1 type IV-A pilus assembly ATPase PilB [Gammaproteobacteria bacterium]MBT4379264.1 type IV-A pilus assembly ATPase PilB [Gammaproteobacteria bacterium]MBT4616283.1 type IV-A pilus assembly ATPase PilB [Gammaproteobacteria bacterium]MBT5196115.1 type IV-A pilus assembly ATPase PilB [Gammaproteobacteria bacterium]
MAAIPIQLSGLARRLVEDDLLEEDVAREATDEARKTRVPFVTHLVQNNIVDSKAIATSASEEFGTPLLDITALDPDAIPKDLVDEKLIRSNHAIPVFHRGNRLFVAVSDPTNRTGLDEIKFQTGISTEEVLVEENKLAAFIENFLESQEDDGMGDLGDDNDVDLDMEAVDETGGGGDVDEATAIDDTPVVRFINKMLMDAIRSNASDLHFEPFEKAYRVRFRTDGVLREIARPPVNLAPRISARLKVMSKMDISERRVPQDGRIKLKISKTKSIDFRVNTLPVLFGEKLVLRILDPSSAKMGIDALGYEDDQKKLYMEALYKPQGMFLVTGPTGSGKTVSLYTGLNILNTAELNISTAEDPVEINLEGINQCNVNTKVGLDFSEALRSFLRQDPDIIMVGEIRDLETASISVKAAQTGHMVMSTLHTNSAPETLTRLRNMGIAAFNLATSVNLIVAQRLGRRLCGCKEKLEVPDSALLEAGFTAAQLAEPFEVFGPKGCEKCSAGYKGRVGIYETMKVTAEIRKIIMEDGNALQIGEVSAREGFGTIYESGLRKVISGATSLAEVNRVTSGH